MYEVSRGRQWILDQSVKYKKKDTSDPFPKKTGIFDEVTDTLWIKVKVHYVGSQRVIDILPHDVKCPHLRVHPKVSTVLSLPIT